jgi:DNA invertase Pin-like site-specific DNA recombinase
MTNLTKRAAIYVRISSEEQVQGYSLAAQERATEIYCKAHGWDITRVYRDEGRSARTDNVAKRPGFVSLLEYAQAGLFDVIVVHKNDRLARNRRIGFESFDILGKAGVGFVSIAENMDYGTPSGQLMLTMLVGLNQFYSDNLSLETRKGKAECKAQGFYNGLLAFGVATDHAGMPILDMESRSCEVATRREIATGDGLVYASELARAGKTDREIALALNQAGYRTTGNRGSNSFQKDSVRVMLRNRFYVGNLPGGQGGWIPGPHGALIDPDLFQAGKTPACGTPCDRDGLPVSGPHGPFPVWWSVRPAGSLSPLTVTIGHAARAAHRATGANSGRSINP